MSTAIKKWAKGAPVGAVSKRKTGDYKKVASGKWVRLPKKAGEKKGEEKAGEKKPSGDDPVAQMNDKLRKIGLKESKLLTTKDPTEIRRRLVEIEGYLSDKEREELHTLLARVPGKRRKWREPSKEVKDRVEALWEAKLAADAAREEYKKRLAEVENEYPDGPKSAPDEVRKEFLALTDKQSKAVRHALDLEHEFRKRGDAFEDEKVDPEVLKKSHEYAETATGAELQDRVEELKHLHRPRSFKAGAASISQMLLFDKKSDVTPEDVAIIDGITHFTNGSVEVTRDPSKYDPNHAVMRDRELPGVSFGHTGNWISEQTPESYKAANQIMTKLAAAPANDQRRVVRGMGLPKEAVQALTEGNEFDLRNVASFSYNPDQAEKFANNEAIRKKGERVVFELAKPARGTNISHLSTWDIEEEFVTGGKVRVTGRREVDRYGEKVHYIEVEQI